MEHREFDVSDLAVEVPEAVVVDAVADNQPVTPHERELAAKLMLRLRQKGHEGIGILTVPTGTDERRMMAALDRIQAALDTGKAFSIIIDYRTHQERA